MKRFTFFGFLPVVVTAALVSCREEGTLNARDAGLAGDGASGRGGSVAAGGAGGLDASMTASGGGGRDAAIVDAGHEGHAISDGGSGGGSGSGGGGGLCCTLACSTEIVDKSDGQNDAATAGVGGCGPIQNPPHVFGKRSLVKLDCAPASDWDYIGSNSDNSTHYASGLVRLPGALAVSGNYLYYTNNNGLLRLPTTGGAPVALLAASQAPSVLTADQSHVYGGVVDQTKNHQGTIIKIALTGGAPEMLAQFKGDPVAIAVDADNVYFITAEPNSSAQTVLSSLMKVPLTGGNPTKLSGGGGWGLAVSPTDVYVPGGGGVSRVPIAGGNSTGVGPGMGEDATSVVYHAGVVYWTGHYTPAALIDWDDHSDVWAFDPAKRTNDRLACWQDCQSSFCDARRALADRLTVQGGYAYWVNGGSFANTIMKMPTSGGDLIELISMNGSQGVYDLVTDATSLYYTSPDGVMKLTPN